MMKKCLLLLLTFAAFSVMAQDDINQIKKSNDYFWA